MKDLTRRLKSFVFLASLTMSSAAFAIPTQDFTAFNDYSGIILPGVHLDALGILGNKSLSDTFDLTADGFAPGVDTAISGTAFFDVTDIVDIGNRERISVDLGSIDELSKGKVHDYSFSFNTAGGTSDLTVLADINADGKLNYKVTATTGGFFLDDAELDIVADVPDDTTTDLPVPDKAATISLLGLSLCGISVAGRKSQLAK